MDVGFYLSQAFPSTSEISSSTSPYKARLTRRSQEQISNGHSLYITDSLSRILVLLV